MAKRQSYIAQAWLVIVLAVIFGSSLAAVHIKLAPVIEQNRKAAAMKQVPRLVAGPDAKADDLEITTEVIRIRRGQVETTYPVYRVVRDGELIGWAVRASGAGFADKIELLLGVDPEMKTITGMAVLAQNETPGVGNKIEDPPFTPQFRGKSAAGPLTVVKSDKAGPSELESVSGATISSESVAAIVNQVISDLKPSLQQRAGAFNSAQTQEASL